MSRRPNHLYLRLIETNKPLGIDRLEAVTRALAALTDIKVLYPPKLDGGGGIEVHVELPPKLDRSTLGVRLEEIGYRAVF